MLGVVPSAIVDFIDRAFPEAKNPLPGWENRLRFSWGNSHSLAALSGLIENLPSTFLICDQADQCDYLMAVEVIRHALAAWRGQAQSFLLTTMPGEKVSPVVVIRRVLMKCPDELPDPTVAELSFLEDPALCETLRLDSSVAYRAYSNGEWKAATVLAGSVVEALLLWSVEQHTPEAIERAVASVKSQQNRPRQLDKEREWWGLDELTSVARELKAIKITTAEQIALARSYRNLIHPGRTVRTGEKCGKHTATTALAALETVINDLELGRKGTCE